MTIPSFPDCEAFNVDLEEQCHKRQHDVLRGQKTSIGERLQVDLAAMRMRTISFDAIKHLLSCRVEQRHRDWTRMFIRSRPEPTSPQRRHHPFKSTLSDLRRALGRK